ncbi:MAG TPA: transposase [Candidatus Dojkabacteria bacterium]|nr:transposase [Candidatus Dojkabacteria bacterium]
MKSITFNTGEFKVEKTSAWLVAFIKFAQTLGALDLLDQIKVKMKEIDYTVHQKMMTLLLSVVIGCRYTSDINQKLVPDTVAANLLDMKRFPDQSQVNELLRRIDSNGVEQLKNVHHQMFVQNAQCLSTKDTVVVDIDQSGLIANGKTYELAQKGYFSKKKNQKGYQLSAAFCGNENSETISMYLDSGNTHCSTRLEDLVKDTLVKLADVAKDNRLILRMDSGYGSDDNIHMIKDKVLFVAKAYSTVRATNIAKSIKKIDWEEVDGCVDLYEFPDSEGLRHVIVRTLTGKGDFEYTMLVTNIPLNQVSAVELFHFYNKRQTIEAFFKKCKDVYHIRNLRTRKFDGIHAFLWIVFTTHNLLSWFKGIVLSETKFEDIGTKTLVDKLGSIVAEVRIKPDSIEVVLPQISALARKFVECLQPKYEQLSLFSP